MGNRSQLDRDILDLLDQAKARLLAGVVDVAGAKNLIMHIRDCAEQASKAKLGESAGRLIDAADALEKRLQSRPHL